VARALWFHDGTSSASPTNLASGKRYRGFNTLALWVSAMTFGYVDGLWGTYRQWQDADAQVRKGERSTTVVRWKPIESSDCQDDAGDEASGHRRIIARAFSVFNIAQVDGYESVRVAILPESQRLAYAEAFIANLSIETEFGGTEASYRPSWDTICMPDFASFPDPASVLWGLAARDGSCVGCQASPGP
jgi:antirestriction protein ArdC